GEGTLFNLSISEASFTVGAGSSVFNSAFTENDSFGYDIVATRLRFATQPPDPSGADTPLTVRVDYTDVNGNRDRNNDAAWAANTITISRLDALGTINGGNLVVGVTNGRATFSTLDLND